MANIDSGDVEYYVKGIHCASCKKIIEERLVDRVDVCSARVDLKKQVVYISGEKVPSANELTKEFFDVGYIFTPEKHNVFDVKKIVIVGFVAMVIFFFLRQSEKFMFLNGVSVDESSGILSFLILGFIASISSCVALVGGVILSLTRHWSDKISSENTMSKMYPHFQFHLGRLAGFFIGGGLLGLLGGVVTFNNPYIFAILILIISLFMALIGLQMIGLRFAVRIHAMISELILSRIHVRGGVADKPPVLIGASTFFLPCGFTLIAQGIALATGDFLLGASVMSIFAVGTLPVLMGISLGGFLMINKKGFEPIFNAIVGTVIVVFALYTINGQLNVLGLVSVSNFSKEKVAAESCPVNETSESQELRIIADGFEYEIIGSNQLKAGVPTKMIVDNQGIAGCGAFMAARGLLDEWKELKPGINEFEFTPKAGKYKVTCTMGMVSPVTIIVK